MKDLQKIAWTALATVVGLIAYDKFVKNMLP